MELALLHGIRSTLTSPFMDVAMVFFTVLGEHGAIWIILAVCLLCRKTYRIWGILMLVAMALVYVCGMWVLKPLVARPRPFSIDPSIALLIDPPTGYSFPSGHSSASFAAASVLCCMPIRRCWKIDAIVLASLVAFSRLYLCVHYPTDVVTGIILGVAFGVGVVFAYRRITTRRKVKGETDVRA